MMLVTWYHVLLVSGILSLAVSQSTHTKDSSICSDFSPPGNIPQKPRPNVTNMFNTWVECVIVNKNKTTDVHEYFDADHNRGFIEQIDLGLDFAALYDYNSDEFITWYPQALDLPGTCQVTQLSKTDNRFLLGYQRINGNPHIFSANDALHLSGRNINEVYMGMTTKRGITVDWWRSCQYWRNMDATMVVDWYFSAKPAWDSAVGIQIPVQAHVKGIVHNDTAPPHKFDHYYNFIHFSPYPSDVHAMTFETPAGLRCPGRVLTKKLPKVPDDAFSFITEVFDLNTNSISFLKETFYYSQKLVKFEHRSYDGTANLVEVHDFHSGLSYTTDKDRGNCTVRVINRQDFDDRSAGANDVRIRNSKEFFYFDSKTVTYEGVKTNRKVPCDSWLGTRTDFPFSYPVNSTWQWFFAATPWQEVAAGPEQGAIPVQMRIYAPQLKYNFQYNIYDFKKDKPDLLKFDISACYNLRNRTKFQILLPRQYMSIVSKNIDLVRSAVQDAVVMATGVKHIRVANIHVFLEFDVRVAFEILDVSPIMGDTQRAKDYYEVPLNTASNTLIQQIANGQFVVTLHGQAFNQPVTMVVENTLQVGYSMPNQAGFNSQMLMVTSLYLNTTAPPIKKAGYGAGPMAAVGITMPIVGGGLGLVFAYFFFK